LNLLEDGLRALARNSSTLLLGTALVLVVSGFYYVSTAAAMANLYPELLVFASDTRAAAEAAATSDNTAELAPTPTLAPPSVAYVLVSIVAEVLFAILISAIYALVFARFGRALDRPIWKCPSDAEAIRRFFMPWLILTLSTIALRDVQANAGSLDFVIAIELLLILVGPFVIPFGACVMHHGALAWEEIGTILAPIGRQFRMLLPVLALGIFQYILQNFLAESLPAGEDAVYSRALAAALLNVPLWILDDFKSKWVRAYFDVGNVVIYGYPEDWIRTLGDRIIRIHIKDFKRDGYQWKGLYEGDVNWAEVRKAFHEIGYTGWMNAELPKGDEAYLREVQRRMVLIGQGAKSI